MFVVVVIWVLFIIVLLCSVVLFCSVVVLSCYRRSVICGSSKRVCGVKILIYLFHYRLHFNLTYDIF